MPVKWTSTLDQVLLLKILETNPGLKVDTKTISEGWPPEHERPTPRAITERLVTIRKRTGASSAASNQGNTHNEAASANGSKSLPSTPKKTKVKEEDEDHAGGSTGKRKRQASAPKQNRRKSSGSGDREMTVSARELEDLQTDAARLTGDGATNGGAFDGFEDIDYWNGGASSDADVLESPTKRLRVSGRAQRIDYQGMVEDDEDDEDSM